MKRPSGARSLARLLEAEQLDRDAARARHEQTDHAPLRALRSRDRLEPGAVEPHVEDHAQAEAVAVERERALHVRDAHRHVGEVAERESAPTWPPFGSRADASMRRVTTEIHGRVDPRFARVRDAFARNFAERGELGASLCVIAAGRTAVDLWGGFADPARERPWREDTLVMVHSATKGAAALCAHVLAARGALDVDAPVARYWPEFAAAGKERIPVRMLLNHRAGLAAIDRSLRPREGLDWETMADALARAGSELGAGRAARLSRDHVRLAGRRGGAADQRPLARARSSATRSRDRSGLDFWIGLPEAEEPRVARIAPPPPVDPSDPFGAALLDHGSLTRRAFMNPSTLFFAGGAEFARRLRAAEIPAANGIANARGLAGLYAPLAARGGARSSTPRRSRA